MPLKDHKIQGQRVYRDLAYWKVIIFLKTLNFFCVKSVHKILNENSEVVWTVSSRTLTFAYVVFNKIKLYRPEEAPDFKWRNTQGIIFKD
jgi:hypothetical protein